MEAHELDGLLVWGSASANCDPIRFLSGYIHVFPGASSLLLVPRERDPVLLVDQPWHLEEARQMSWVEDVRPFPSPSRRWLADELGRAIQDAVGAAGLTGGRLGVFPGEMPAVYTKILGATLADASFTDGAPVWEDIVGAPSPYDVEKIKKTAAVADLGLAGAVEAAGEGVPEYEVCLASLKRMAAAGADFLHGSGMSTHVNTGSFSDVISNVRPHLFSRRPLEAGQMFWFDLSACYEGYYTDTDRTISVGEPYSGAAGLYAVAAEMYRVMLVGGPRGPARRGSLGVGNEGRRRCRVRRLLEPRLPRTHHRYHDLVASRRGARGDSGAPRRELPQRRAGHLRAGSGLGVHREHAPHHQGRDEPDQQVRDRDPCRVMSQSGGGWRRRRRTAGGLPQGSVTAEREGYMRRFVWFLALVARPPRARLCGRLRRRR